MATPFNGTITFLTSEGTVSYDCYASDAAGLIRFSKSGVAGTSSPDFIQVNNGATIIGLDFPAAATVTNLVILMNDEPKQSIKFANLLNTLATRTRVSIPVPAGTTLRLNQA